MAQRKSRFVPARGSLALSETTDWYETDEEFERLTQEITESNGLPEEDGEVAWGPKDFDWDSEF